MNPREPICLVSPHLDDVVLSCASFLFGHPGAVVVTVIAGAPQVENWHGNWHLRTTGESSAPAGVDVRRREDVAALSAVGARPVHLGFWDAEYVENRVQDVEAIAAAIGECVDEIGPRSLMIPLGIHHSDHVAVGDACLRVAAGFTGSSRDTARAPEIYLYAELPYAVAFPEEARERVARITADFGPTIPCEPVSVRYPEKLKLVKMYTSQYEPLRHYEDFSFAFDESMTFDERFWRLVAGEPA